VDENVRESSRTFESVREREVSVVSLLIASKLLESGEEVYRQYPNGCVYVYRDGKYAHVARLAGVFFQHIEGPGPVFRFTPSSRGHIRSLHYKEKAVSVISVKCGAVEQLAADLPHELLEGLPPTCFTTTFRGDEIRIELSAEVEALTIGYATTKRLTGEFKPYSKIRDLSMDCGKWFVLQ
jgi:hypothetical protein